MKYFRVAAPLVFGLVIVMSTISSPAQNQKDFVYLRSDTAIYGFSVPASGDLQPIPGSPFSALGSDSPFGFYGVNRIIVNGDFLYASNGLSGNIAVFSINRVNGNLSPVSGTTFPFGETTSSGISLGVTSDNRYLYAVNPDSGRLNVYSISVSGELTMIAPFTMNLGTLSDAIKVSADGRFLAIVFPTMQAVGMYRIQGDGSLAQVTGSPFPVSRTSRSAPAAVDINCAGDLLFVGQACSANLCGLPTQVDVFSIAPSGFLTPIPDSPFIPGVGFDANVVSLSRDDRKLFVTNQASHTVTVLQVAANGNLTLVPGSPFHDAGFALSPAGVGTNVAETLLLTTNFHGPLSVFKLGVDGVLTTIPGSPFPAANGQVLSLAVYPAKACVPVAPFDICIQDDTTANSLKLKSITGEYQFRTCSGESISGIGTVSHRGSSLTLEDISGDRRISATIDTGAGRAIASIQILSRGESFTILDRRIDDDTCGCQRNSRVKRVPADFATIQQAISAAADGDTVLVAPGTYTENINFVGKAITVKSEAGAEVTTIDGRNHFGPTVTFASFEGRQSVIDGFTIQKGVGFNDFSAGGGISIVFASPTIMNNIVTDNSASSGAGIGVFFGTPLIENNRITNNVASNGGGIGLNGAGRNGASRTSLLNNTIVNNRASSGGGIWIFNSNDVTVSGNRISNNSVQGLIFGDGTPASQGGGILLSSSATISLIQNLITNNNGGLGAGLSLSFSNVFALNNTIAENSVTNRNSALHAEGTVSGTFYNNLLIARQGQNAIGCGFSATTNLLFFSHNDIYSSGGLPVGDGCSIPFDVLGHGNLSIDPLFLNLPIGDFHLQQTSPALEAGDNLAPFLPSLDLDGHARVANSGSVGLAVVDMGAFELQPMFDTCLKDDISGNSLQFNSTNGNYRFSSCKDNLTVIGTGTVRSTGCKVEFTANDGNGVVTATVNTCTKQGTATFQSVTRKKKYAISDSDISNNICSCR
jgi:6-phosphogluconolactonase (cycloisomerase 2 family)